MWKVTWTHQNKQTFPNMEYCVWTLTFFYAMVHLVRWEKCYSHSSNNRFQSKSNTIRNEFSGYKEINAAWQPSGQLKLMKFCLVNNILVSPFDNCLQALVDMQVRSVTLNESNTRMRQSDIFCCDYFYQIKRPEISCLPILSSTTLSQLFLARVNFLFSSSSIVW